MAALLLGITACEDGNEFGSGYVPSLQKQELKSVIYHTVANITSLTFEPTSSSQNISVTSNEEWTATSDDASWCTVSPSLGNNNGSLSVTVTENTSPTQRNTIITIIGKNSDDVINVAITQKAVTLHTSVSSDPLYFEADAAESSHTITVISNEEWTATSDDTSWCTVTPASGSGGGTVTVKAMENTSNSQRTATITIRGKASGDETMVLVRQDAPKIPNEDDNPLPQYSRSYNM